jgi:GR25 family glycosyltransferase involved in LPS biosynthesis
MSMITNNSTNSNASLEEFEFYVINLDRSQERWQRINTHLRNLGLFAQRISAVDAAQYDSVFLSKHYCSALNKKYFFIGLKPAEIGCFLSHRKTLQAFLADSTKKYAVILEDDVEFVTNPSQFCDQWCALLNSNVPVMIKLFKRRRISGELIDRCKGTNIIRPRLIPLGTQAQIVNRSAAQALLIASEQFSMPVDVAYQHWWHHGVKVLVTAPNQINEISQAVGGTNIGGSAGFSFGFKVQREVRRSWFRLKLKLASAWFYFKRSHS